MCSVEVQADNCLLTTSEAGALLYVAHSEMNKEVITPALQLLTVELGDTYIIHNYNPL